MAGIKSHWSLYWGVHLWKVIIGLILISGDFMSGRTIDDGTAYMLARPARRSPYRSPQLIIDSGCTHHVVNNVRALIPGTFRRFKPGSVMHTAENKACTILGRGRAWWGQNVYVVPDFSDHLISVFQLNRDGHSITFNHDGTVWRQHRDEPQPHVIGYTKDKSFLLDPAGPSPYVQCHDGSYVPAGMKLNPMQGWHPDGFHEPARAATARGAAEPAQQPSNAQRDSHSRSQSLRHQTLEDRLHNVAKLHCRMGHMSIRALYKAERAGKLNHGMKISKAEWQLALQRFKCSWCSLANCPRLGRGAKSVHTTPANKLSDVVQVDIMGPVSPTATDGSKYMLVAVDRATRMIYPYFMRSRNAKVLCKTLDRLLLDLRRDNNKVQDFLLSNFIIDEDGADATTISHRIIHTEPKMATNERIAAVGLEDIQLTKPRTMVIRSDNEGGLQGHLVTKWCEKHKIRQQFTVRDHSLMNGLAEAAILKLTNMARVSIVTSQLSARHWPWAYRHAAFQINRLPHTALNGMSSYEKLTGMTPDVSFFRPFGAPSNIHVSKAKSVRGAKVDPKATGGIAGHSLRLISYAAGGNGYVFLDPDTYQIHTERDCYIYESFATRLPTLDLIMDKDYSMFDEPALDDLHDAALPVDLDRVSLVTQPISHVNAPDALPKGGRKNTISEKLNPNAPPKKRIPRKSSEPEGARWTKRKHAFYTSLIGKRIRKRFLHYQDRQGKCDWESYEGRIKDYLPHGVLTRHRDGTETISQAIFEIEYDDGQVEHMSPQSVKTKLIEPIEWIRRKAAPPPILPSRRSRRLASSNVAYFSEQISNALHARIAHLEILKAIDIPEPKNLIEALDKDHPQCKEWTEAWNAEYESMKSMDVFDFIPHAEVPRGATYVKSSIVFKVKPNKDGSINKYKIRWVAGGYSQKPNKDFFEVFSPTVRPESVRILLSLAAINDLEMRQFDVKTAFLHAKLDTPIYMKTPVGLPQAHDKENKGKVIRLNRALYGLRQSSRIWWQHFSKKMKRLGFRRTDGDACLYYGQIDGVDIVTGLYVDDLIVVGAKGKTLEKFGRMLAESSGKEARGEKKDNLIIEALGEPTWILGMGVTRNRKQRTITLDQQLMIDNLYNKFCSKDKKTGPRKVKDWLVPMSESCRVSASDMPTEEEKQRLPKDFHHLYMSLIGSLTYIQTRTRPDVSFAVSRLARYMVNPGKKHMKCAIGVLKYLHGQRDLGLTLGGMHDKKDTDTPLRGFFGVPRRTEHDRRRVNMFGFSDASFDDCEGSKSTLGYCLFLGAGLITWRSTKSSCVALSTCEAEYYACCLLTKDIVWARSLLDELGFWFKGPTPLYVDNSSAQDIILNPKHHNRTKHIRRQYNFIKECARNQEIVPVHVGDPEQVADVLTKPLGPTKFVKMRRFMLNQRTAERKVRFSPYLEKANEAVEARRQRAVAARAMHFEGEVDTGQRNFIQYRFGKIRNGVKEEFENEMVSVQEMQRLFDI